MPDREHPHAKLGDRARALPAGRLRHGAARYPDSRPDRGSGRARSRLSRSQTRRAAGSGRAARVTTMTGTSRAAGSAKAARAASHRPRWLAGSTATVTGRDSTRHGAARLHRRVPGTSRAR